MAELSVELTRWRGTEPGSVTSQRDVTSADPWNPPSDQRQDHMLADQPGVAFVIRVNGDGGVAKFGLRTGGGQFKRTIFHVVQRRSGVLVIDLDIGKAGAVESTVINQALTPVNEAFIPHFLEGIVSAADDFIIERKGVTAPVDANTETAELRLVISLILGDKVPDLGV